MRALDQAGNVGEHELAAIHRDDAEPGIERGEGVVGDLRLCCRDRRQKGRLAGIRQPDQARIGDQFQPQPDRALLAFLAGIGAARRAVRRRLEMGVAEAAIAALGEHHALADFGQVGDQRLAVFLENLRARRHAQHGVGAARTGAVPAHPVHAGLGFKMLLVAKVDQRVEAGDALDDDVAAAPAVAAVRPAELDELFAPKRQRARAAIAGADKDAGLIEELHRLSPEAESSALYSAAAAATGNTETNERPLPFVRNSTLPSAIANSVWSVPTPTLAPACHLVPRWRTRMLPLMTLSPPNFFTPRRRPAESRPLRDEPPAFL